MFRVTAVNVSADALHAGVTLGRTELGELPRDQLIALLDNFTRLNAAENHQADPCFEITGRSGRFLVRTALKRLFLYAPGGAEEPSELTAVEIAEQLERPPETTPPFVPEAPPDERTPSAPHRGLAVAIIVVSLAVNAHTVHSVFHAETVEEQPVITLVTDAKELATRQGEVVGSFATGDQPGDRGIVVQRDGQVRFYEIGSTSRLVNNLDTYQIGRRSNKFCLITRDSGVVKIIDKDTLMYFRDAYKRAR